MFRILAAFLVSLAIFFTVRADAENLPAGPQGPDAPGRYVLQEVGGGHLRLDTATGIVSFCHRATEGWVCELVSDDMRAIEQEISDLTAENEALRARIVELEKAAGLPPGEKAPPKFDLPDEQEIEKVMSYFERMMQRLIEMMKSVTEENRQNRNGL